jgi:hypothetical protein
MLDLSNTPADWRDDFVLVSEVAEVGARARHYRDVDAGRLVPIARGVYLRAGAAATDADRYLARIRGMALELGDAIVFSHLSAARLWRLPIFERWPRQAHLLSDRQRGGRNTPHLVRHLDAFPEHVAHISALMLTSLARTVADVAATSSLRTAVVIVDAALAGLRGLDGGWIRPPLDRVELLAEVDRRAGARGVRQLRWAAEFGQGLSGSPGESISRLTMHQIGCPPPELQRAFYDIDGRVGIVDFWWPDFRRIGEFDGRAKYLRAEFTAGKDAGEIVMEEKIREDRLRALGPGVTRWEWEHAISLSLLRAKLVGAGLPCTR